MSSYGTKEILTPMGVKILAQLMALKSKPHVKVGVLAKAGAMAKDERRADGTIVPGPVNLITVALAAEYGTDTEPRRAFIALTEEKNRNAWQLETAAIRQQVIDNKMTVDEGLKRMGLLIKKDQQAMIRSSIPPENAESTKERKHSSTTLVDTGQLINALDFEVHREGDK